MSTYPPARYHGDTGRVSATLRRAGDAPELSSDAGTTVHYLAQGSATSGEFGLYRWTFGPEPSGPDPHFHRTISESFFVLAGTVRLFDGREWVDGGPGDFLFVPEGGLHGFRNEQGVASMLILFAPGAPREDYFETLFAVGRGERTLSEEERAEFMLYHDTYWR